MSKDSDEFLSPPVLMDLVYQILGNIDFDPYSSPNQIVKCRDGLTLESDAEPWPLAGTWYANIPFSESSDIMPKLANHFTKNPKINALVVCLAAPSSAYWAETIFSPAMNCRRVGWLPRLKFWKADEHGVAQPTKDSISRDIAITLWSDEDRLIKRFEKFVPSFNPGSRSRKTPVRISLGGRP